MPTPVIERKNSGGVIVEEIIDSDIDDNELSINEELNYNYDIIGLKEPSSQYQAVVKNVLRTFYKKTGDQVGDADLAVRSRALLAIDIEIY